MHEATNRLRVYAMMTISGCSGAQLYDDEADGYRDLYRARLQDCCGNCNEYFCVIKESVLLIARE
jgi:hypothetical protein